MANTVIALKKSATPSATPVDLANGELAINYADGKLFYKAANGTISSISGNEPNYFGTVNANNTLVVADTPGDILTLVAGNNILLVGDAINDKITVGLKDSVTITGDLFINNSQGLGGSDEGGEFKLANATSAISVLNGPIVVDIYQNKIRFFESGSPNRGAFINLAAASASVGTDLLATASATDTLARATASQAFDKANDALPNISGTWFNGTLSTSANFVADKILSTNNGNAENFKVGDDAWIGDFNTVNSIRIKGQQNPADGYINFGTGDTKVLGRSGTGPLTYDGSTIWHAGNDGVSSGLDADLLDGQHGSYYGIASDVTAAFASVNAGFAKANTANITADRAWNHANAAFITANIAFANANTVMLSTQAAFTVANSGFIHANAAYIFANSISITANLAFAHANAAFANGNTVIQTAQSAFTQANLAFIHANNAFASANAGQASGNAAQSTANAAFNKANTANITADRAWNHANAAFITANIAFANANTVMVSAQAAFTVANSGFIHANAGYAFANSISTTANAAFLHANAAFANANTVMVSAQAAFTVANSSFLHANAVYAFANSITITANLAFAHANAAFANGNTVIQTAQSSFTLANIAYAHANTAHASANAGLDTANAGLATANAAITHANQAFAKANTANITADRAWNHANAAFDVANTSGVEAEYAFLRANLAHAHANASFANANTVMISAQAAFTVANSSFLHANAAYSFANSIAITANLAFAHANSAYANGNVVIQTAQSAFTQANLAFIHANNAFASANAGQASGNAAQSTANAAFNKANTANITADRAWNHANAAFASANIAFANANTVMVSAQAAFTVANSGFIHANAAYAFANSIAITANLAFSHANAAFNKANTANITADRAWNHANAAFDVANTSGVEAEYAFLRANLAHAHANASYTFANSAHAIANLAFAHANAAFLSSNGVNTYTNSTYVKLTAPSQTITGDLDIVGTLTLSGNTVFIDATRLQIDDPLIYLAGNNYTSDIVDIGFIANYVNATGQNVHTGLYREHETKEYYLFQGYDKEPANNHIGALSNNMTLAVLNADIRTSNIILGGANVIVTIGAAFGVANTSGDEAEAAFIRANLAHAHANAAHSSANAGMAIANAAFASANAGQATANAAFNKANTTNITADRAWNHANAAFASANIAFANANTVMISAQAAFTVANSGFIHANAAYAFANSIAITANLAFAHANLAFANGNTVIQTAQSAFNQANLSYLHANAAFASANAGQATANAAFNKANTANITADRAWNHANAAFITANAAVQNTATVTFVGTANTANNALYAYGKTEGTLSVNTATQLTTARAFTIGSTAKNFNGTAGLSWTTTEIGAEYQAPNGIPRSNLGDPTVREMALFDGQFTNKTELYDINNVFFETSTDNISWSTYSVTDAQKRVFLTGDSSSTISIPYGTAYFRVRLRATAYWYLNALYSYFATQGHTTQVQVFKKHDSDANWTQHTNSTTAVGSWPGHLYLPFSTIPWNSTATLGVHYHEVYILFIPSWNGTYPSNNIALYKFQLWGGYPAGKRNLYTTNEYGDATFPSNIAAGNIAISGLSTFTGNVLLGRTDSTIGSRVRLDINGAANASNMFVNGNMVWHQGNDGALSGLDADLLDGQHASYYGISTDVTAAFLKANTANITADRAWNHANAAFASANIAFANANTVMVSAQAAFTVANSGFLHANSGYAFANSIAITANLAFAHANLAFANGNTVIQTAQSAFNQANLAFIHANNAFASANAGQASANAGQATANAAFNKANTANITADRAWNHANAAFATANIAFANANTVMVSAQAAFTVANSGFLHANAVYAFANSVAITANLAFIHANNAYAKANAAGGGVTTSDTAPGSPTDGSLWWNSAQGKMFVYYDDGTSSQWVESTPNYVFNTTPDTFTVLGSYTQANTARDHANAAFLQANSGSGLANTSGISFNGNLFFPTGNVGIGTSSALAQLDIASDGNTRSVVRTTSRTPSNGAATLYQSGNSGITKANGFFVGISQNNAILLNYENSSLFIGTNNSIELTVDRRGNVLLSRTDSTVGSGVILDVAGAANASNLLVNGNMVWTTQNLPIATQTDMETGTSTTTVVTPGRQHFHPSAAKFWVKADAAGATQATYNMTSVSDTGTGRITLTIATNFSSSNWVCLATAYAAGGPTGAGAPQGGRTISANSNTAVAMSVTAIELEARSNTNSLVDPTNYFAVGFGDQ